MSSPLFQEKKDMFTNREYPAAFMLKHMTKDLKLSNEENVILDRFYLR